MLPQTLDNIFPYLVLGYGVIVTAVVHSPLVDLAEGQLPRRMAERLVRARAFGLVCVGLGFAWSMQTLWFAG